MLLKKRIFLIKHAKTILLFSGVASCILLAVNLSSYDFEKAKNTTSITDVDKFTFSKNKNIFLFVLDGFQSDLFWEIIDKQPEIKNKLSGFTFYPDTAAAFSKTYPTIPLLLTGKIYQKQQSILDFINNAYKDSLLSELIDAGWNVGLYPHIKNLILLDASVMDNTINKTKVTDKIDSYLQMLDLSLFRLAPHPIKKRVFNQGDFVIKKGLSNILTEMELLKESKKRTKKLPKQNKHFGINFLENMKDFTSIDSSKPVFRYYHFLMPHASFLLNRDLEYGHFNNKNAYKNYAYASLKLMISYLDELKKQGVYDKSAILILADHGGGLYMQNKYDAKTQKYVSVAVDAKEKASSRSLLLIKNFNQRGILAHSDNQISLTDVAPTIAGFAGIDINIQNGMKIEKHVKQVQRERIYYYFDFTGWNTKYLDDFVSYKITGNVYNDDSWVKTGVLKTKKEFKTNKYSLYVLNKTISYGRDIKEGANYNNSFLLEKYKVNHSSVSSKNKKIQLLIKLEQPLVEGETYKVELTLSSNKPTTKVSLEAEGKELKTAIVGKKRKKLIANFYVDSTFNAKALNFKIIVTESQEKARISLVKFKLTKRRLMSVDEKTIIKFSDNVKVYQPEGFSKKERWGRWSKKKTTKLTFKVDKTFCEDGYMQLNINRFYTTVNPEKFQVFINDHRLKRLHSISAKRHQKLYYDCSSYHRNNNRNAAINLTFKTDKVVSPSEVSNSKDPRKLGVGFLSLRFGKLNDIPVE